MKFAQQRPLQVAPAAVWAALNDTTVLQACMPGCESLTQIGPDTYEVKVLASVGPVKARFKGTLRLADQQPPTAYRLHFELQGGAAGHGKGEARVWLVPGEDHRCVLHYEAHASIGGKIAQIGQRLVDMSAQHMANSFFTAFEQRLKETAAEAKPETETKTEAPAPARPRPLWRQVFDWLLRRPPVQAAGSKA